MFRFTATDLTYEDIVSALQKCDDENYVQVERDSEEDFVSDIVSESEINFTETSSETATSSRAVGMEITVWLT